jgi:hypothetical protein
MVLVCCVPTKTHGLISQCSSVGRCGLVGSPTGFMLCYGGEGVSLALVGLD